MKMFKLCVVIAVALVLAGERPWQEPLLMSRQKGLSRPV